MDCDDYPRERSKLLSETYRNLEIPLSEDVAINRNKFPEFILCHNGDVLKKRKRKKILILPNFLSDYNRIYSKCLLYLPIESELELKMGDVKELLFKGVPPDRLSSDKAVSTI